MNVGYHVKSRLRNQKLLGGRFGSVFAGQPTLIYSLSVAAFGTFN